MRVLIDTDSRHDALRLAGSLPGSVQAGSVRGYGLIRTTCRDKRELEKLLDMVDTAVQVHELRWVRVRLGDDEHVFRGNGGRGR